MTYFFHILNSNCQLSPYEPGDCVALSSAVNHRNCSLLCPLCYKSSLYPSSSSFFCFSLPFSSNHRSEANQQNQQWCKSTRRADDCLWLQSASSSSSDHLHWAHLARSAQVNALHAVESLTVESQSEEKLTGGGTDTFPSPWHCLEVTPIISQ